MDKQRVDDMVKNSLDNDVPADVEERLLGHLQTLRSDIARDAVIERHRPYGWAVGMRLTSAAAVALLIFAMGSFIWGYASKPTWAQVSERFASVSSVNATIYVRQNLLSDPVQVDLWITDPGKVRMRSGNAVIFCDNEGGWRRFEVGEARGNSQAREMAEKIVVDALEDISGEHNFSLETLLMALPVEDAFSQPLVNQDATISRDMVIFDMAHDDKPEWVRIWALRESRLPVRVHYWDAENGESVDVVLQYADAQSPEFYDADAFARSLSELSSSGVTGAYNLQKDPGGRPITPSDLN